MPMFWKENQPSTSSSRVIIVAKTGRLMQKSALTRPLTSGEEPVAGATGAGVGGSVLIRRSSSRCSSTRCRALRPLHPHLGAVEELGLPAGDDDFAFLQAGQDFLPARLDPADQDFAAA